MPGRRRRSSARRLLWAVAAVLAALGLVLLLTDWIGDPPWWVGAALVVPLAVLILLALSTSEPSSGPGESGYLGPGGTGGGG